MLLRDERQMAVNEVERLCFEAADYYDDAAGRADEALAALFRELADQHRQYAAALAEHIRALDDLPRQPDPDREAFDVVVNSLRALLSGDTRHTLIEERKQTEQALANAAQEALRHELSAEAKGLLNEILAHAQNAIARLDAADKQAG